MSFFFILFPPSVFGRSLEKIRLGQIKRGLPTRATARVKRLVQRVILSSCQNNETHTLCLFFM